MSRNEEEDEEGILSAHIESSPSTHGLINYSETSASKHHGSKSLKRSLTFTDGLGIIVGIIIGSGIFSSPGTVLSRAGSPGAMILAWIISGLLVLVAAQCYMELGGMYPSAGGDYDYLRRAYGNAMAFSFAWFYFFISKTGSCAIIGLVFGQYISVVLTHLTGIQFISNYHSIGEQTILSKILAILVIIALSILNCLEVKESVFVQKIMTSIKICLILLLFILAIIYQFTSTLDSNPAIIDNLSLSTIFHGTSNLPKFWSSLVACLWCFDGWGDLNFMQEELLNPSQDFVRTMLTGITVVTIAYVFANISYLAVMPSFDIKDSTTIAIDVGYSLDSAWGTQTLFTILFALGVAFSAAGSLNGTIMTGGRIFYAVARAGDAPTLFAQLNSNGVPWIAILCQCVWSILLLLFPGSSFSTLLDYYGCMSWLYYALVSFGVIILRYREPLTPRPYKAWLYPFPPILVVFMACTIMISSLINEPAYTIFAISSVLISYPVYYFYQVEGNRDGNDDGNHRNNARSNESYTLAELSSHTEIEIVDMDMERDKDIEIK